MNTADGRGSVEIHVDMKRILHVFAGDGRLS